MKTRSKIKRLIRPNREIKENLLHFYNASFPKSQWSMSFLDSFFHKKNNGICFLVKNGHDILAFALGRIQCENKDSMTLSALYVDPQLRGGGYGGDMIKIFLAKALQGNIFSKAIVHFRDSNDLKSFYKKSGFENHTANGYYSNGEIKHQMEFLREE